jgi:hypothetical protein
MKRTADAHALDTESGTGESARNPGINENDIDEVLAESFPASDPPPWTLGVPAPPSSTPRKRVQGKRER